MRKILAGTLAALLLTGCSTEGPSTERTEVTTELSLPQEYLDAYNDTWQLVASAVDDTDLYIAGKKEALVLSDELGFVTEDITEIASELRKRPDADEHSAVVTIILELNAQVMEVKKQALEHAMNIGTMEAVERANDKLAEMIKLEKRIS